MPVSVRISVNCLEFFSAVFSAIAVPLLVIHSRRVPGRHTGIAMVGTELWLLELARATLDKQSCVITSMLFEMNSTCMRSWVNSEQSFCHHWVTTCHGHETGVTSYLLWPSTVAVMSEQWRLQAIKFTGSIVHSWQPSSIKF